MRKATADAQDLRSLNVTRMSIAEMRDFTPIRPEALFYVVDPHGIVFGPAGSAEQAKAIIAERRQADDMLEWHIAESGALQDVIAYIESINSAEVH